MMEAIGKLAEITASRCIDGEEGEILEDGEIDEEEVVETMPADDIENETIIEEEVVVNDDEENSEEEEEQKKHRKKSHHRRRKRRHDDHKSEEKKSRHKKRKVCVARTLLYNLYDAGYTSACFFFFTPAASFESFLRLQFQIAVN